MRSRGAAVRQFGLSLVAALVLASAGRAAGKETAAFLDANEGRYRQALGRARAWIEALEINPVELRRHGIKGKKKVAEWLDAAMRLYEASEPSQQAALRARIERLSAMTRSPGYHDMARVPDRQFKEDSTSYLRTAYLLDRFGLDVALYRREIRKIQPRLDAHLVGRGVDQRMAFHEYYRHFGLAEPFPLQAAFRSGVIAERRDAAWFLARPQELYRLTHEIFVPYEFGARLEADFFSAADKAYLRPLLADVTAWSLRRGDSDIAAELTSCLRYLGFTGEPVYMKALEFLLAGQRPEGCWGDYEALRPYYGDFINSGFYLHTTLVALDALVSAFHTRP